MNPSRKIIVFDIESGSLPEEEILRFMPNFEAPSNWKDPDKIKAVIDSKKVEWMMDAALSPVTGRVEAIGYEIDGQHQIFLNEGQTDEISLIMGFFKTVRDWQNRELVGFNIKHFDLPFLVRRAWKLGVTVPQEMRNGRYWDSRFVDLMEEWQMGERQDLISLDRLARFMGLEGKTSNGAMFQKLERQQKIDYLTKDLVLTRQVAQRMMV